MSLEAVLYARRSLGCAHAVSADGSSTTSNLGIPSSRMTQTTVPPGTAQTRELMAELAGPAKLELSSCPCPLVIAAAAAHANVRYGFSTSHMVVDRSWSLNGTPTEPASITVGMPVCRGTMAALEKAAVSGTSPLISTKTGPPEPLHACGRKKSGV